MTSAKSDARPSAYREPGARPFYPEPEKDPFPYDERVAARTALMSAAEMEERERAELRAMLRDCLRPRFAAGAPGGLHHAGTPTVAFVIGMTTLVLAALLRVAMEFVWVVAP